MVAKKEEYHAQIMDAFCRIVQLEDKPLVLKGGTALLLCYGLDRFSEDLDFDMTAELKTHLNLKAICSAVVKQCQKTGVNLKLVDAVEKKKTKTTHRVWATYEVVGFDESISIKIEVSARDDVNPGDATEINGIKVYRVGRIAEQKLKAASINATGEYRTAARDLHDLVFIATQHSQALSDKQLAELREFLNEPAELLERYESAYETDPLLHDRLYDDLAVVEKWLAAQRGDDNLSLLTT